VIFGGSSGINSTGYLAVEEICFYNFVK